MRDSSVFVRRLFSSLAIFAPTRVALALRLISANTPVSYVDARNASLRLRWCAAPSAYAWSAAATTNRRTTKGLRRNRSHIGSSLHPGTNATNARGWSRASASRSASSIRSTIASIVAPTNGGFAW